MCNKYRHIDQWNRRKNLETNTSFYVANYFWEVCQDHSMGKRQFFFNKCCWKHWISTFQRMNLDSYHSPHTKNNSKCIKYLNVSIKTMNLLEENIGEYLWPSVKQWFLKYDLKVQATCFKRHHQESKKTTHRMKRYFHVVCLIRNWYDKYIKSSYNSISLKKKKS